MISRFGRAALVLVTTVGASGCTDWAGYDLDSFWGYIPALSTMRNSVAYDPYDLPRLPAEHTIPVASPMGDAPPPFTQLQLDSIGATLTSPYSAQPRHEVMVRGEVLYQRQCAVCHGPVGQGTGPIVGPGKYPFAPALTIPTTAARSDGYLYAIITAGRGLMPPYGHALTHEDRWAVVSYVRQLQAQAGAPATAAPDAAAAGGQPSAAPGAVPVSDTVSDSVASGES